MSEYDDSVCILYGSDNMVWHAIVVIFGFVMCSLCLITKKNIKSFSESH